MLKQIDIHQRLAYCSGLTPFGTVVTASLNSPLSKWRHNGIFSITLRLSALDAAPLIQRIDARLDQVFAVTANLGMSVPYEPENDGSYVFTFTKQARTTDILGRATRHAVGMYDAKSRRLPKFYKIILGSSVRVSYGFSHEYGETPGVTLELLSVQTAWQCVT